MDEVKSGSPHRAAMVAAIAASAYLLIHLFSRAPMMGDDIDYYGFALDRLVPRPEFPPDTGFHFLRWTVWGPTLLFMKLFGFGIGAFQFVPFASMAVCCALAYLVGTRCLGERGGMLAALLVFFHPLMNDLAARPMPDIVEALLATLGLFVLLEAMRAPSGDPRSGRRLYGLGALAGLLVFLSWVNRPTGLIWLIAALLIALSRPRIIARFFGAAVVIFVAGMLLEAVIYHEMFGDYFHRWNANLTAVDRKGTEPVPLWWLPLRYLDVVASGGALKTILFVFAIYGGVTLWRAGHVAGRVVVAWAVLLYLGVSCGVQSLFPLKPLVREGERFIGNLAIPLGLCAAAGLLEAAGHLRRRWPMVAGFNPILAWALLASVLLLSCGRPFRDMAYLPSLRSWLEAEQGAVAVNEDAYHVAWVAAPHKARALDWKIVQRGDVLKDARLLSPAALDPARTLILNRPRFMVTLRKRLESKRDVDLTRLPGDLFGTDTPWKLTGVAFQPYILDKEAKLLRSSRSANASEFLRFQLGRQDEPIRWWKALPSVGSWQWNCDTAAGSIGATPEGGLHFKRLGGGQARLVSPQFDVPAPWRGAMVQTRILAKAPVAEPFETVVAFTDAKGKTLAPQVLRQYASPTGFYDFGGLVIPREAATARILIAVKSKCPEFDIVDVRLSEP